MSAISGPGYTPLAIDASEDVNVGPIDQKTSGLITTIFDKAPAPSCKVRCSRFCADPNNVFPPMAVIMGIFFVIFCFYLISQGKNDCNENIHIRNTTRCLNMTH